jgi:hypothetical protein
MKEIRNMLCLIVLVACIVLSFKGFPFGIISFIGFLTGLTGWTAAISAICHPMGSRGLRRLFTIFLGFAIASAGRAIVNWGGLASIGTGGFTLSVANLGAYIGVFGGLLNLDKSMHITNDMSPRRDQTD